jgi:hemerythrin-like domain-containing protein
MKPRGPLMIEHRLIEEMLAAVASEARRIRGGGNIDPLFVDAAIDFIRTYADRTHHGKEEDILFQQLARKPLGKDDAAAMAELVDEHREARERVKTLLGAKDRFQKGDSEAAADIISIMEWLADFYPRHIRKEDKDFFPRTESYFSAEELGAMLEEFRDFDGKMIHEKYGKLVESLKAWRA